MKLFFLFISLFVFSSSSQTISVCSDLLKIQNNLNGSFYLSANLNCSKTNIKSIGNSTFPFSGTLDGKGFQIFGLNISVGTNGVGLFSVGFGSTVMNLVFDTFSVIIPSGSNLGLIFGNATNVSMKNVSLVSSSGSINQIKSSGKNLFFLMK